MSGSLKLGLYIFASLLALFVVVHVVQIFLHLIGILIPILVVAGVVALIVTVVNRKALLPGRRRILP